MSLELKQITDRSFETYGRVLTEEYQVTELLKAMEGRPLPSDVIYVPSDKELEGLSVAETFTNSLYGGLPIQIGYCNGHNQKLNALEYHRSSEINIAATDLILLIGRQQDITSDFKYDTSKVEAFFVPKNTVLEVYATTLHYAPCGVNNQGFKCVVVLPKDTNLELEVKPAKAKEDILLVARNKWLIAHDEAKIEGAFAGLVGANLSI